MRIARMDLMQVHNLPDVDTHLKTLRDWKVSGLIRYLGVTHYHAGAHAELAKFIVSHSAATCAIPASSKEAHLRDNMGAGVGRMPDAEIRRKIVQSVT